MLTVENLSIQYGARTLFRDLSFTIRAKDRWALAGPNGAGKSTLMKIIAGLEVPNSGRIVKAKQSTVGYLPQEGVEHRGATLYDEACKAFDDVLKLKKHLAEVEAKFDVCGPQSPEYGDLLEVFGDIQLRLEHHDIDRIRPSVERVLHGLGFRPADLDRPCEEFSGGWQMRIALAKLLLEEPSVLLLDEPTNHLDIDTVQWLEQWLRDYSGAVLLISHDRTMLDQLAMRTLAFENGKTESYSGNYSSYLKEREVRREQLERAYKNQQREIERTQKLIDRFRAKASKAKMVQSRIKQLEKIALIELEQEAGTIHFDFPQPERSGETVLKLEGVQKFYGDLHVLRDLDLQIDRGDRIAIVGVNGAGKSTFSRIISFSERPTSGSVKLGHKVAVSFFSQNHADELDPAKTVLETLEGTVREEAARNLRSLLGAFLFRGDDVFKQVGVLSGGERGRLALARMLLQPSNFLVLDEPTNHLDLQSQEILQRALQNYEGTFVIVSHNRAFLDPVVTKVLEFSPGRSPRMIYGKVSDYLEKKTAERSGNALAGSPLKKSKGKPAKENRKQQRRREAEQRQAKARELKPLQEEVEQIESKIEELEQEKTALSNQLTDPEFFKKESENAARASQRFAKVERQLEAAYTRWSELSDEMEKLTGSAN